MPRISNPKEQCSSCNKLILRSNMSRHEKLHARVCPQCSQSFPDDEKLQRHIASKHAPSLIQKKKFSCRSCNLSFSTYYQLIHHKRNIHHSAPVAYDDFDLSIYGESFALRSELETVKHFLQDSVLELSRKKVHNFKLVELSHEIVINKLDFVYKDLPSSAKINISFGFVLQSVHNSDEFRYYYAADNNPVFLNPLVLSDDSDLSFIKSKLRSEDFLPNLINQRPDAKWKFYCVTNVTFFVFLLSGVPLGCIQQPIPSALVKNPLVKCFISDGEKKPYQDNLCMFRALTYEIHGSDALQQNTLKLMQSFLSATRRVDENFPGIHEDDIPVLEEITGRNIQIYSIFFDEQSEMFAELSRRSCLKRAQTTSLLRYENHICWTADVNKFLKKFRCYVCDQFFDRSFNLMRHMQNCSDNIHHKYPTGAYQLAETIFDRLDDVKINVPQELRLFSHLIVFDFESITVPDNTLRNTDLTSWIGKHVPISVSIASKLLEDPIFICNEDAYQLIRDFVSNLTYIAEKSTLLMREKLNAFVLELEEKYGAIRQLVPVKDNKGPTSAEDLFDNEAEPDEEDDDDLEIRRLRCELKMLSNLRQDFENYYSTIPVFGFNSSRYDLNLIKEFPLHHLLIEKNVVPKVIRMGNKYIGMNFLGLQFLDILNFLGGATTLDNFLKAYGASEEKGFFPYEWFDSAEKMNETQLPPIESFWSKLKNHNVLSVDYDKFMDCKKRGIEEKEALKKLKLKTVPKNAAENYRELHYIWEKENMNTFRDFLKWYNNKDVMPTLDAMTKMIQFYHSKQIDMLKLGYTLPNLANRFLHSSTDAAFFPFCEQDKEYDNYIRNWLTGGPSIIFTRYAKVGETKIRESENVCKSIVGIDASQLYPFSMTKEMPTGLYTKWEFNVDTAKFHPKRNWRSFFEQQVIDYLQSTRPECLIQSQFSHKKQKRIGTYLVDGFCSHCNTVFEAMGCYFHFCPCQEEKPLLFEDIENGLKTRERDSDRREYLLGLGYTVVEIWECQWKKWRRENINGVKEFVNKKYPFQQSLSKNALIEKIKRGDLFGVVDCSLEVPEELYPYFENFPPIFKNCEVGRDDIGDHMKEFAERHKLLSKPRKMLISSFKLDRGPIITPLLLFYLEKGLVLTDVF